MPDLYEELLDAISLLVREGEPYKEKATKLRQRAIAEGYADDLDEFLSWWEG